MREPSGSQVGWQGRRATGGPVACRRPLGWSLPLAAGRQRESARRLASHFGHAGHGLVTIFVDDIEALVASIAVRGIAQLAEKPTGTVYTRRPRKTPTATRSGSVDSSADAPSPPRQRSEPYTSSIVSD